MRRNQDLTLKKIFRVLKEFEEIQGLRLLLSEGEPLFHPRFLEINEILREHTFRSILLSNDTLITKETAKKLRVHEVQVSLDCNMAMGEGFTPPKKCYLRSPSLYYTI